MATGGRKHIAWFFILMLAGHEVVEAARVRKERRAQKALQPSSPLASDSDQDVEATWKAENEKCTRQYLFWCEEGPANPNNKSVHRCAKQPLVGDIHAIKYQCRVTDEWMLQGTPEKPTNWWLTMQIKLLQAKSAKLTEHCSERTSLECKRRMQHILRSVRFIAKVSKRDTLTNLTPEQLKEARDAASDTMEAVIQATVPVAQKRNQINRLIEALKKDQHGFEQNPKAAVDRGMEVIQEILADDADSTVAEEKIQQMELEAKPAGPEDEANVKALAKEREEEENSDAGDALGNALGNAPRDDDEAFDDVFQKVEDSIAGDALGNATSLVHLRDAWNGGHLGASWHRLTFGEKVWFLGVLGALLGLYAIVALVLLPFVIALSPILIPLALYDAWKHQKPQTVTTTTTWNHVWTLKTKSNQ